MRTKKPDLVSEKLLPRDPERIAKHITDLLINDFTLIEVTPVPDDQVLVRMERRATTTSARSGA
ncbi:MAG TPA: hypothetical protein VII30_00950 [Gemmatimonadaceae bacterium]